MIALHFGHQKRPLLGIYHPSIRNTGRRAVLIMNPGGWEYLRAYRSLRYLAERLQEAGCDVFRFDYRGTGDSWGNISDVTSLDDWMDDSALAVEELCGLASVNRVSLVGLRLGSILAAELARRLPRQIDRLVLWEPLSPAELRPPPRPGSPDQQAALALPDGVLEGLAAMRFGIPEDPRRRVLVAASEADAPSIEGTASASVSTISIRDSPKCWIEESDFGAGAVPVPMIASITRWVAP